VDLTPYQRQRRSLLVAGLAGVGALLANRVGGLTHAVTALAADVVPAGELPRPGRLLPSGHLHTRGAQIVAGDGTPVRLAGVNWYGFETPSMVVGGLDHRSFEDICATIVDLGFNMIRLPFSMEMVTSSIGVESHVDREPSLRGRRPIDIMDRLVDTAGRHGLKVILDSHRCEAAWSLQSNGLWYTPEYSESRWIESWLTLVDRYQGTPTVVGCDLRNEPGSPPQDPDAPPQLGGAEWGTGGDGRDWAAAAERVGDAILTHNRDLLICVEGVRDDPSGPRLDGAHHGYWPGGNLSGVGRAGGRRRDPRPIRLRLPHRLVYSVHDYGPDMARGLAWAQLGSTASTAEACRAVWDQTWGYLVRHRVAPVWVGEFGTPNGGRLGDQTPPSDYTDVNDRNAQGAWFTYLVDYIRELGLSWSIWALNGTQSPGPGRVAGEPEWYGVLRPDWVHVASSPMMAKLHAIQ
jgi:endoglucanase